MEYIIRWDLHQNQKPKNIYYSMKINILLDDIYLGSHADGIRQDNRQNHSQGSQVE